MGLFKDYRLLIRQTSYDFNTKRSGFSVEFYYLQATKPSICCTFFFSFVCFKMYFLFHCSDMWIGAFHFQCESFTMKAFNCWFHLVPSYSQCYCHFSLLKFSISQFFSFESSPVCHQPVSNPDKRFCSHNTSCLCYLFFPKAMCIDWCRKKNEMWNFPFYCWLACFNHT